MRERVAGCGSIVVGAVTGKLALRDEGVVMAMGATECAVVGTLAADGGLVVRDDGGMMATAVSKEAVVCISVATGAVTGEAVRSREGLIETEVASLRKPYFKASL